MTPKRDSIRLDEAVDTATVTGLPVSYPDSRSVVPRLKRKAEEIGLKINTFKSKYLLTDSIEFDRNYLGRTVVIDEFVYVVIIVDRNSSREIGKCIFSGSRTY